MTLHLVPFLISGQILFIIFICWFFLRGFAERYRFPNRLPWKQVAHYAPPSNLLPLFYIVSAENDSLFRFRILFSTIKFRGFITVQVLPAIGDYE